MDPTTVNELRRVATATDVDARVRLAACDQLASVGNFYGTRRYPIERYTERSERGRKFLRLALRRLLRSKMASKKIQSGARRRLLLLKGYWLEPETQKYLTPPLDENGKFVDLAPQKPPDPVVETPPAEKVDPVLEELQRIIAQAEAIALAEESGGQKPDAEQQTA